MIIPISHNKQVRNIFHPAKAKLSLDKNHNIVVNSFVKPDLKTLVPG